MLNDAVQAYQIGNESSAWVRDQHCLLSFPSPCPWVTWRYICRHEGLRGVYGLLKERLKAGHRARRVRARYRARRVFNLATHNHFVLHGVLESL